MLLERSSEASEREASLDGSSNQPGKSTVSQKKRKERHLEFSTDPVSGNRSYKGIYSSAKFQKRNEARNSPEGGDSLNFLPAEGT